MQKQLHLEGKGLCLRYLTLLRVGGTHNCQLVWQRHTLSGLTGLPMFVSIKDSYRLCPTPCSMLDSKVVFHSVIKLSLALFLSTGIMWLCWWCYNTTTHEKILHMPASKITQLPPLISSEGKRQHWQRWKWFQEVTEAIFFWTTEQYTIIKT